LRPRPGPSSAPGRPPHGRFAPSPTGPLHLGSLIAALGSYLDARAAGGRWSLRIDDLDAPRCARGAEAAICTALERLGFAWDGEVVRQQPRRERYREALAALEAAGLTYPCGCTRREVAGRPYPGTCRGGLPAGRVARSVRVRADGPPIALDDRVQGRYRQDLAAEVGDFVVRRADAIFAYHLATVVDDADAGVTRVVRGADLLASTPRQIHLQRLLGLPTPEYAHLPVAMGRDGAKLSKQNHAPPIDPAEGSRLLCAALAFLGQRPPAGLERAPLADFWAWALAHWRLERVPRRAAAQPARTGAGSVRPAGTR